MTHTREIYSKTKKPPSQIVLIFSPLLLKYVLFVLNINAKAEMVGTFSNGRKKVNSLWQSISFSIDGLMGMIMWHHFTELAANYFKRMLNRQNEHRHTEAHVAAVKFWCFFFRQHSEEIYKSSPVCVTHWLFLYWCVSSITFFFSEALDFKIPLWLIQPRYGQMISSS